MNCPSPLDWPDHLVLVPYLLVSEPVTTIKGEKKSRAQENELDGR